jgi:hypothetical protein
LHSNLFTRSNQRDPSLEAAKRVEKLLATALEGESVEADDGETTETLPNVPEHEVEIDTLRHKKCYLIYSDFAFFCMAPGSHSAVLTRNAGGG